MRCGLLKQHRQLSYEELAFHLEDSASFRAFARLPLMWTPKKSVLHMTISAIQAETWEAINRILLASARQEKVETGKVVRLDSTVTAALLHEPSDSSLLWDAVRVMVRLVKAADALIGGRLVWRNHPRAAKKRARVIEYARDRPTRVQHYRELIKLAQATLAYADQAAALLWRAPDPMTVALWHAEFRHYRPLIERIIAQIERRVLQGEAIPANDKIVSLFEPHAHIIVKGGREVQCGHKLNLTTGRSGLILDLVIEAGNPADSERFLPMLNRHIGFYGEAPQQTAADGGFASRHNLGEAKALGVRNVAFHKKAGPRHGHGQEQLGLSQAARLPSQHRVRHLVLESRLWSAAVHLARARPLQGIRLVVSRRLQPCSFCSTQARLTDRFRHRSSSRSTDLSSDRTRMALRSVSAASSRFASQHQRPPRALTRHVYSSK